MPFVSKSQQKFMFAKHPKIAKRWAEHTPDIKSLPEKVEKSAFVRTFVSTFLTKLGMTEEEYSKSAIAQAVIKSATAGPVPPAAPAAASVGALETEAKGLKALSDVLKGRLVTNIVSPVSAGYMAGGAAAKLFRPSDVEVGNLQKRELLTHYDSAINELERRIGSRQ